MFIATVVDSHSFNKVEPTFFTTASKIPAWKDSMAEEFNALQSQNTWLLTTSPMGKNVVLYKLVYNLKYNPEDSIARHKAGVVAKGFIKNRA